MNTFRKLLSVLLCAAMLFSFALMPRAAAPEGIDAKGAVLMDLTSGKVLFAKEESKRLYPASVTKIMALILVMEALDQGKIHLTDKVSASRHAVSFGGSQIWLKEGEVMSVNELLKAVVVASANDACTALGEFVAGSDEAFVKRMNEKAAELGMNNTHFQNCTGLDDGITKHYSTAYDIALMSRELMRHDRIREYTGIWMDSLRDGETMLVNTNRLVRDYDGCIGLKTGTTTKAGFCVSAVAQRENTRLCAVIMGAKSGDERFEQAAKLLNFGFAEYETVQPPYDLSQSGEVRVKCGMEETVPIAFETPDPAFTVEKGSADKIKTEISLKKAVAAPVQKGEVLGEARFFLGQTLIGTVDIVATRSVEKMSFWRAVENLLKSTVIN